MSRKKSKKQKLTSMNIDISEYDKAYNQFVFNTLRKLMEAKNPVLNIIQSSATERHGANIVGGNSNIQLEPIRMETSFYITFDAVKNTSITDFLLSMEKSSDDALKSCMPQFYNRLSEVVSENTIDAQGQPPSPDHIIDAIDKMQLSFDENDEPILPTLIMHPQTEKIFKKIPWTPEHDHRLQQVLTRKKDEYIAKKRIRKLR